jgi:hypothetical protein
LLFLTAAPVHQPENNGYHEHDKNDGCPKAGLENIANNFTGRKGHCQTQCIKPDYRELFHAISFKKCMQKLCRLLSTSEMLPTSGKCIALLRATDLMSFDFS